MFFVVIKEVYWWLFNILILNLYIFFFLEKSLLYNYVDGVNSLKWIKYILRLFIYVYIINM